MFIIISCVVLCYDIIPFNNIYLFIYSVSIMNCATVADVVRPGDYMKASRSIEVSIGEGSPLSCEWMDQAWVMWGSLGSGITSQTKMRSEGSQGLSLRWLSAVKISQNAVPMIAGLIWSWLSRGVCVNNGDFTEIHEIILSSFGSRSFPSYPIFPTNSIGMSVNNDHSSRRWRRCTECSPTDQTRPNQTRPGKNKTNRNQNRTKCLFKFWYDLWISKKI